MKLVNGNLAVATIRTDKPQANIDSVFLFNISYTTKLWTQLQVLFVGNDSYPNDLYSNIKLSMSTNNLYTTFYYKNSTKTYLFTRFNNFFWSQQQILSYPQELYNETYSNTTKTFNSTSNSTIITTSIISKNISTSINNTLYTPNQYGSTLIFKNNNNELMIYSNQLDNNCFIIGMSDHFNDGWDIAVLTVRAPDMSNDTFSPHCNQIDPFYIRYCPSSALDNGKYIIKVFNPTQARFYWEIQYRIKSELNNIWYYADFASEIIFNYNSTLSSFVFVEAQNLINLNSTNCYQCGNVEYVTWSEIQLLGKF